MQKSSKYIINYIYSMKSIHLLLSNVKLTILEKIKIPKKAFIQTFSGKTMELLTRFELVTSSLPRKCSAY